jgi:hypothetical protein
MKKLIYTVPESHLESTKVALFGAGAGKLGDYEHCCWQVLGQGQFKPSVNANPFIGQLGEVTQLPEYRVEVICDDKSLAPALTALREAHPYEEPAIDIVQLINPQDLGI